MGNTGEKAKEIESENQKSFEENSKIHGGIAETLEDKIKGGKDVGLGEEKGGIIGLGTEVTEVGLTSLHKAGHWLAGTGREFKRKIKEGLQKSDIKMAKEFRKRNKDMLKNQKICLSNQTGVVPLIKTDIVLI